MKRSVACLWLAVLLAACAAPRGELLVQRILVESISSVDRFLAAERAAAQAPAELRALAHRLRVEFPLLHEEAARLWLAWRTGDQNPQTWLDLNVMVTQLSALSTQAEHGYQTLEQLAVRPGPGAVP